ncbi:hypothetical protein [Streptomyces sp. NPDC051567]|uniref:hypothetical protein n=1 Tax=Streptomyces sp. NPDC051567 TaxID=3365660 RepID=UPI00379C422C
MSATTVERVELSRFLTLTGRRFERGDTAPEMFSGAVDAEWHRLLDDPDYPAFCAKTAGQLVLHAAINGAGPVSWVSEYEAAFGCVLPDIWFTDAEGNLDTVAVARYRDTGEVLGEWNCSPTGGDGDDVVPSRKRNR